MFKLTEFFPPSLNIQSSTTEVGGLLLEQLVLKNFSAKGRLSQPLTGCHFTAASVTPFLAFFPKNILEKDLVMMLLSTEIVGLPSAFLQNAMRSYTSLGAS